MLASFNHSSIKMEQKDLIPYRSLEFFKYNQRVKILHWIIKLNLLKKNEVQMIDYIGIKRICHKMYYRFYRKKSFIIFVMAVITRQSLTSGELLLRCKYFMLVKLFLELLWFFFWELKACVNLNSKSVQSSGIAVLTKF